MKRALIIYNPAARNAPAIERIREAAGQIEGWEAAIELTERADHATELARHAAESRMDAAVACGGDGTVNEVVNGLAGSTTALAVVRAGTANVWAKEARLPRKPAQALRLLTDGEEHTVDLGRAGERYFLLMAGVGFDASIVRSISGPWKRRLGAAAYVLHGLRQALHYRAVEADVRVNGDALAEPLYWLLLGNTRSYAGVLNVAYRAVADDGQLDLCLLRKGGLLRLLTLLPWVLLRRHGGRRDVLYRSVAALDVATAGLPVQIDGEYVGDTPLRFSVAPGALRVIVPRGLKSPLFGER